MTKKIQKKLKMLVAIALFSFGASAKVHAAGMPDLSQVKGFVPAKVSAMLTPTNAGAFLALAGTAFCQAYINLDERKIQCGGSYYPRTTIAGLIAGMTALYFLSGEISNWVDGKLDAWKATMTKLVLGALVACVAYLAVTALVPLCFAGLVAFRDFWHEPLLKSKGSSDSLSGGPSGDGQL